MSILERGKFKFKDWYIIAAIVLAVIGFVCLAKSLIMFII